MERLTSRMSDGTAVMAWGHEEQHSTNEWVDMLQDRLAAYEDTGLEPEEIKKSFNEEALLKLTSRYLRTTPDRLCDLTRADQEGRLVVLAVPPSVRPGSSSSFVYIIEDGEIFEDSVYEVIIGEDNRKTAVMYSTHEGILFRQEDIGKTVFRTEEQAKAALLVQRGTDK